MPSSPLAETLQPPSTQTLPPPSAEATGIPPITSAAAATGITSAALGSFPQGFAKLALWGHKPRKQHVISIVKPTSPTTESQSPNDIMEELAELYKQLFKKGHPINPSFGAEVGDKVESLLASATKGAVGEKTKETAGAVAQYIVYLAQLGVDFTIVHKLFSKIIQHPEVFVNLINGQNAFFLLSAIVFSSSFDGGEQGMLALFKKTFRNIFGSLQGDVDALSKNLDSLKNALEEFSDQQEKITEKIEEIKKGLREDPDNPNNLISLLKLIENALSLIQDHPSTSPATEEGALAKLHQVLEPVFRISILAFFSIPFVSSYDTTKDEAIRDFLSTLVKFCFKEEDKDLQCALTGLASMFDPGVALDEDQTNKLYNLLESIETLLKRDAQQEKNEYKWKSGIYTFVTFGLIALAIKNAEKLQPTFQKLREDASYLGNPDDTCLHSRQIAEVFSRALVDIDVRNIDKDSLANLFPLIYELTKKFFRQLQPGTGANIADMATSAISGIEPRKTLLSLPYSLFIAYALTTASCSEAIAEQLLGLPKSDLTNVHAKLASEAFLKYFLLSAFLLKVNFAVKELKQLELGLEVLASNDQEKTKLLIMQLDDLSLRKEKPVSSTEKWDEVVKQRNSGNGRETLIEALLEKNLDDHTRKYLILKQFLFNIKHKEHQASPDYLPTEHEEHQASPDPLGQITTEDILRMGLKGVQLLAEITELRTRGYSLVIPPNLLTAQQELTQKDTSCYISRLLALCEFDQTKNYDGILKALDKLDQAAITRLTVEDLSTELQENRTVVQAIIYKLDKLKTLERNREEEIQNQIDKLKRINAFYIEKELQKVLEYIKELPTAQFSNKELKYLNERFPDDKMQIKNAIREKLKGTGSTTRGGDQSDSDSDQGTPGSTPGSASTDQWSLISRSARAFRLGP